MSCSGLARFVVLYMFWFLSGHPVAIMTIQANARRMTPENLIQEGFAREIPARQLTMSTLKPMEVPTVGK